jgi:HlyD family secretion protein
MLRLLQRLPKATKTSGGAVATADEPMPLALLEFQSPTAAVIATPTPLFARSAGIWVTLLVVSMLLIAGFMPIDMIVSSTGDLVTTAPTSVIQPFETSIVHSINVDPGQFVKKGDVLATLDPTYAQADLTAYTTQVEQYSAQVAQLQAQEDGKPYDPDPANPAAALQFETYTQQVAQYRSTVDDYDQKIAALQTAISGYNEQAAYYKTQIGIAADVQTMRTQLQNMQVGSKLDTESAESTLVSFKASLASAQSSAIQSQQDLQSQQAEKEAFIQQWNANISTQLATAINNLSTAQQALTKAKLNNQLVVLRAPEDSIVQAVAGVSPGAVLQAGDTLMQTVPANAPLEVQAEIEGTESGFVHVGDPVQIKFQSLDYMQFGAAKGIVQSISPTSINPTPGTANPAGPPLPGGPTELYYNATISLEVLDLHNTPAGLRIVPGMPVDADIQVGSRTILQYFARKVIPIVYDSMHEPF